MIGLVVLFFASGVFEVGSQQKAIAMPGVKEKLAVQGVDPMPVSASAFDAQVRAEVESNIALARAAGIKAN